MSVVYQGAGPLAAEAPCSCIAGFYGGAIYVLTGTGVMCRSTDGTNWTAIPGPDPGHLGAGTVVQSGQYLYVLITGGGYYRVCTFDCATDTWIDVAGALGPDVYWAPHLKNWYYRSPMVLDGGVFRMALPREGDPNWGDPADYWVRRATYDGAAWTGVFPAETYLEPVYSAYANECVGLVNFAGALHYLQITIPPAAAPGAGLIDHVHGAAASVIHSEATGGENVVGPPRICGGTLVVPYGSAAGAMKVALNSGSGWTTELIAALGPDVASDAAALNCIPVSASAGDEISVVYNAPDKTVAKYGTFAATESGLHVFWIGTDKALRWSARVGGTWTPAELAIVGGASLSSLFGVDAVNGSVGPAPATQGARYYAF